MIGGLIAGGLGAAFAAVAQVLIWTGMDRELGPGARSLRIMSAAFVGGDLVLGMVIVILTLSLGGTVDPLIGLVSAAHIGLGSFGIALTFRSVVSKPSDVTAADRSRAILRMAFSQAAGTLGAVLAILSIVLSPI